MPRRSRKVAVESATPESAVPPVTEAVRPAPHVEAEPAIPEQTAPTPHTAVSEISTSHSISKRRSIRSVRLAGVEISLVDDMNHGGLGIRFEFAHHADRPSDAVKTILRETRGHHHGFEWKQALREWRRPVGANPISSRLDAEARFEAIVQQMRHEKGLAPDAGRTPF